MQLSDFISNFVVFSGVFYLISCVLIIPTIFIKIIIPQIERQVGVTLIFEKPLIKIAPMYMYKASQVMWYITWKYLMLKIAKRPSETVNYDSNNPLQKINYRVEDASKLTIFLSFFTYMGAIWFLIGGALIHFKIIT